MRYALPRPDTAACKPLAEADEQSVAGWMTVCVVVRLEAVEVEAATSSVGSDVLAASRASRSCISLRRFGSPVSASWYAW